MIAAPNLAVDHVEGQLAADPSAPVHIADVAARVGTTEHRLRRMFSSLAGMPVSEYVRRRRMSAAAADLLGSADGLLDVAVRYGYGSSEAFGRAFRAVHGVGSGDVRRDGGPLRTQPRIRFHLAVVHLAVEESTPRDTRIVTLPAVRLVGRAARVSLIQAARTRRSPRTSPPSRPRRPGGSRCWATPSRRGCSPSVTTWTRTARRAASSPTCTAWRLPPARRRTST